MAVNATGRDARPPSQASGKKKKKSGRWPLDERFIMLSHKMLMSPAWRALSSRAWLVIYRLMIEQMRKVGRQNGELISTYADFREYGVPDGRQREAISEAEALGFVRTTQKGRTGAVPELRRASRYRLTFLPSHDGAPATDEWMHIRSKADAKAALDALKNKPQGDTCPQQTRGRKAPTACV